MFNLPTFTWCKQYVKVAFRSFELFEKKNVRKLVQLIVLAEIQLSKGNISIKRERENFSIEK